MIGERIRARRTELGLSLRDLAKKVDLTASFLSQVERDLVSPSIKSLRRIADALEVPVLFFLIEAGEANPVVRQNQRKKLTVPGSQSVIELLTPDLNRKIEMFITRVPPSERNIAQPLAQPTEECVLVLEGALLVRLNETEYLLEAGDSIYFEGSNLVSMVVSGDEPTVFVSAMTPAIY
jgi:transcriptional regulator with XRE-family HTH domain